MEAFYAYGANVIGFLRLVGLMNAAAWFGGSVFFLLMATPLLGSEAVRELLGGRNFPYFSGALFYQLATRWAWWQTVFALIALGHLLAEWLYSGRMPGRPWRTLLFAVCVAAMVAGFWVTPRAQQWQKAAHAVNALPAAQRNAQAAEQTHRRLLGGLGWLVTVGVGAWLWRVANPPETTKFVSTSHFRG